MTPSLEEIRQTAVSAFKTMHDTYFSTLPIEYPNYTSADEEHMTGPYVALDIDMARYMEQFGIGDSESIVRGRLVVYYLYPENTGMNGVGNYLDKIKDTFCYRQLSGISYMEMVTYNVFPSPGLVGVRAEVKFMA